MDEMCGFNPTGEYPEKAWMSPENLMFPSDYTGLLCPGRIPTFGSDELLSAASAISSEAAPITPEVGAPPEIAYLLDEIRRENDILKRDIVPTCLGADPELDEFMETYCDMLVRYKSDLARPFDEATTFISKVEMQLRNLCTGASVRSLSEEGAASSDEDYSTGGEVEVQEAQARDEDRDLKDRLLRKFGSHIGSLKLEFSKKKKKGKLPKEARQTLLEWWNVHYKWPYPTEADKIALAESTGLDQKQINNWFINQRKRHWKPSENMQFAVMDNLSGSFFTDD
ncbi:hypothetical protein JRO89_XS05G0085400 [Xanthoceras sorbifolium]|uniref:Homeobox protein knotted-1-like 6 n=1 Tax=Xanthoceras sorbifolium TaxID=99658 RepID=A0ABQ8I133_9ROSI|nr:hypothetical protein JRO89_XS05G0085400 [Xanthoceras sorbifolium]